MDADYSRATDGATERGSDGLTVLGLETSCDETAASVVRLSAAGAQVLSSVIHSQIDDHAAYGGVVPEIAARSHVEMIDGVTRRAMAEAGLDWSALDGVAATAGPGLVGGVMVGLSYGKAAALARGLPLIAVNHLEGHAVSARLGAETTYPFLLLLVSGGHCQLLEVRGIGDMSRLGTTIDDAAGEAFDKIAKAMGLGYPGGPALEKLAASGDGSRFELPRALLGRKDCDFSFSGLKTAASRLAQTCETDQDRADLADAVQKAIGRQLAERSERAMKDYAEAHPELADGALKQPSAAREAVGQKERLFVVAGGVAANKTIRRTLEDLATKHGFTFLAPPMIYCTDNAAMIALAGAERLEKGLTSDIDVAARPRWPLDEARANVDPVHKKTGRKGAKA
ncbi:tRNA (adenosine(37)-N6)-threonylcarbamoyltransferase complex transferase subunit TsaD [Brevundimonas diminuta]|uniref:tRNA (adenosine(37)-N6)-threonylcarbamoyltransferase complex transferase subunit TsaD n=1 Tax=Brevundimonas diminuta TaxID=293 RepID=UPI00068335D9|nr:tRNA (adenosine(37)-N6)-threonylcarbamoyltransferase complex transferase subunit TsaD [Brevundimonas diminuta]MBD3819479.1 tRNA (adenosine(37)-N6)-threonylcarbamoyltransferase complex transferase subunit TsaD [Brevundimonas diminuta]OWR17293.1 tRNA (adenosine(37)-N6)-threonylcarbamoyltransferase complex transferase subunit TsaD [Brevundimonas diminuta]WQE46960.1 tRNA (adenosine(37)-N6)-threonylcarbamoyltransferase complex transferase subunit TsaD [Brevundimonas diminuta]